MKTTRKIWPALAALASVVLFISFGCTGADNIPRSAASDGSVVRDNTTDAQEICYKGVVYVWFHPHTNAGWGTIRLDRDTSTVIKCGSTP